MLKQTRASYFSNFKNAQYCALSTDTIPNYIKNGDEVYFIDTAKRCLYDADSGTLIEQPSSGGGSSDWTNASVIFINNTPENGEYFVDTPFGVIPIEEQETIVLPLKKEDDSIFYLSFKDIIDVESSIAPSVTGNITIEENGFEIQGDGSIAFSSLAPTEISGVPPLELEDALARPIRKLIQHGKVDISGTDVICNNGTLTVVDGQIVADGTPEQITLSVTGAEDQTATAENLFAVENIEDTQDIITGKVIRRTEAVVSDGTTPSGRYVGTVGEGNIIVKALETGYSGDIVEFETEEETPLTVKVDLEPQQDLHGYDAPWPAGGGKNKFDVDSVTSNDFSVSGGTFTNTKTDTRAFFQLGVQQLNNGTYIKTVAAYGFVDAGRVFTKISGIEDGITALRIKHNGSTRDITLCDYPWTGTDDLWISFTIVSNDPTTNGGLVISDVQLEISATGSTEASAFAPYSNECPISGWTGANVTRTGKSIVPFLEDTKTATSNYNGYIGWSDLWKIRDRTKTYTYSVYIDNTNAIDKSCVSVWLKDESNSSYVDGAVKSGNLINAGAEGWSTVTLDMSTLPNTYYLYFGLNLKANGTASKPMVVVGSTPADYEAYQGNTYTVTWEDEVFGAEPDVVSGEMPVTWTEVDMGTLDWASYSEENYIIRADVPGKANGVHNLISSSYKTSTAASHNSVEFGFNEIIGINNASFPNRIYLRSQEAYADYSLLNGVQLCFELATPIQTTITPTPITALSGYNNVWADCGDVTVFVPDDAVIEQVAAQKLKTAEGDNTLTVTAEVQDIVFDVAYRKNDSGGETLPDARGVYF